MNTAALASMEKECLSEVEDSGARLDVTATGEHYLLHPNYHTRVTYRLAHTFERRGPRMRMTRLLLEKMRIEGVNFGEIETLIGIRCRGLSLASELQHFPELEHTRLLFIDRNREGKIVFRSGFSLEENETVFIFDDLAVTYTTFRATIELIKTEYPAFIIGFAPFIDRSPPDIQPPAQFAPAFRYTCGLRLASYIYDPTSKSGCPYCKIGLPLVKA